MKKIIISTILLFFPIGVFAQDVDLCTLEYVPVCAQVKIQCVTSPCNPVLETFGNSCEMSRVSNTKYLYDGECREVTNKLHNNDLRIYAKIKDNLDKTVQEKISERITKYVNRLDKYSRIKRIRIHQALLNRIEEIISDQYKNFPSNIQQYEKVNFRLDVLNLLKYELNTIDFSDQGFISRNEVLRMLKFRNVKSATKSFDNIINITTRDGNVYYTK